MVYENGCGFKIEIITIYNTVYQRYCLQNMKYQFRIKISNLFVLNYKLLIEIEKCRLFDKSSKNHDIKIQSNYG